MHDDDNWDDNDWDPDITGDPMLDQTGYESPRRQFHPVRWDAVAPSRSSSGSSATRGGGSRRRRGGADGEGDFGRASDRGRPCACPMARPPGPTSAELRDPRQGRLTHRGASRGG